MFFPFSAAIKWQRIFSYLRSNYTWGDLMEHNGFMRGVGLGMLAGAVVGMVVSPGRKELKRKANKAAQAVGNAADSISDAIQR